MKAAENNQIKDMPARQRVLLLRLNSRRSGAEGKRLQGAVSEAKTDFVNTLKAAVPDKDSECRQVLQRLQVLYEEHTNAKDKKSSFKQRAKDTQHALLFSEISEGGQLVLPGAELELAPEQLRDLKLAVADVKLADEQAKGDPDTTPKFPAEQVGDLDDLEALLDQFVENSGISATSLGAAPAKPAASVQSAPEPGAKKAGRKPPTLSVAPATH
jgi:hypothetical protein